ncbi:hypothetical protein [uncultured Alsobacter sp.]|uniref:hypothetical protein n=1 Tax=uncultured Alsobacter sp. TaxID=1748258 RepID=UPI0025E2BAA3|nr:hypothetical protein [uncultured Alsobacter sp.]
MSADTPQDAFARNLRRLQTEGLDAATQAAIDMLRDTGTPAAARATAMNAVLKVSGMFDAESEDELQPHEMTAEQLSRAVAKSLRAIGDNAAASEVHEGADLFD